ncbi:MAG: hypothetical protein J0I21_01155, partial [Alphaproteobacteria bacterium]|nr:hypothetical protein [Alphaproteobacteria bacterium]
GFGFVVGQCYALILDHDDAARVPTAPTGLPASRPRPDVSAGKEPFEMSNVQDFDSLTERAVEELRLKTEAHQGSWASEISTGGT